MKFQFQVSKKNFIEFRKFQFRFSVLWANVLLTKLSVFQSFSFLFIFIFTQTPQQFVSKFMCCESFIYRKSLRIYKINCCISIITNILEIGNSVARLRGVGGRKPGESGERWGEWPVGRWRADPWWVDRGCPWAGQSLRSAGLSGQTENC